MAKITQCLLFAESFAKRVNVKFDEPHSSSDGGALLVALADQKLKLTSSFAACLVERRQEAKIKHTMADLLRQRVYGLASGYADANDAARLAHDPVFKLLLDRPPVDGTDLSSQPTLSRFENSMGARECYRLGKTFAHSVIARQRKRLRGKKVQRITIDLDTTDDATHGQQELAFYNGHYGSYCYLPLLGFITFDDEPDQYLVMAVLRPGNLNERRKVVGPLKRLVTLLREAFPQAKLDVRLDAGFAAPEMFEYLESVPRLEYVCGFSINPVLQRNAEPFLERARATEPARVYGECRYRTRFWNKPRRVIIKAEMVNKPWSEPRANLRFIVTNKRHKPQTVYQKAYCSRGEIENRIKELQCDMQVDRTSCTRFWANQFRVLLTAAAYALMQELRLQSRSTKLRRSQVSTLREHLLKLSARLEQSVRRIVVHLPHSFVYRHEWTRIARRLGAVPT